MRVSFALLVLMLSLGGCTRDGTCGSVAVRQGGLSIRVAFTQCWDGADRTIDCEPPFEAQTPITCRCWEGGELETTFTRDLPLIVASTPTARHLEPINEACGWSLRAP